MRIRVGLDLAVGLLPLAVVSGATWRLFGLPASYLAVVGALYAVLAGTILATLPRTLRGSGLGSANRITLARGVLVVAISGLVAYPGPASAPGAGPLPWWVIGLATLSMVLDGFDGWIARRSGTETEFGARFDMELDAFLMLVLSVMVWETGKVGGWVVLIGLLRYLFVGAAWVWPALRGELFPSFRRKAVCVVQGVVLLVALGPIIPAGMATVVAAAGLAALVWSFAVDVGWLVVEAGAQPPG